MNKFLKMLVAGMLVFGATGFAQDEPPKPRVSPAASVSQTIGKTTVVTVDYGRPAVKGRTVWGELVPMDKVWRTGANEATRFSASTDVLINGEKLAAGEYSLFTIPGKDSWTIIFNKTANQWGAYEYDEKMDALRITATPQNAPHAEWLSIGFESLDSTKATTAIHWEKVKVPFTVVTAAPGKDIRKSLKSSVAQTIGVDTKIEVVYSRPGVKGRTIWGELVPLNELWRTGANENTVFTTSSDVTVNGQKLPAGSYGLFSIPGETEWTIIFSKKADHRGTEGYDAANDALRITATPVKTETATEWFTIAANNLTLTDKAITAAEMHITWDKLAVPFTVALP